MTKVCIFHKSNDLSRFDIFAKFFECINSKTDAVYQDVLGSERRMATDIV